MVRCLDALDYPDKVWVVASRPWICCGEWLVLLEGYRRVVNINCLEEVKGERPKNDTTMNGANGRASEETSF